VDDALVLDVHTLRTADGAVRAHRVDDPVRGLGASLEAVESVRTGGATETERIAAELTHERRDQAFADRHGRKFPAFARRLTGWCTCFARPAIGHPWSLHRKDLIDEESWSDDPFSIGVEEELFLGDPSTGRQANSAEAVLTRLGDVAGTVERELHACQVELITEVCRSTAEAIEALRAMRRKIVATGAGVLGTGTHPSALEGDAEITDKERYERIRHLLGDAAATPVAGLHIHVGVPDADTAIRTFNGLRRHLPLLQALAANSPFRHGRDTGLASAREVTIRAWPRSGVPRAMRDFDDFRELERLLTRAADVPDYTWFWWKLRPHPRLGTVEIRALDVQTSLEDTSGVVALAHCLARHAAEQTTGSDPSPELLEEGVFRAARFGIEAKLPDATGQLRPVRELLDDALDLAAGYAGELGCTAEIAVLPTLLNRGGGAGWQRGVHEIAGMDALLRELTQRTGGE
jgi:glutamate---cysteine ligase / carboxylate-amine ligase